MAIVNNQISDSRSEVPAYMNFNSSNNLTRFESSAIPSNNGLYPWKLNKNSSQSFYQCTRLNANMDSIRNWFDFQEIENMDGMFYDCRLLTGNAYVPISSNLNTLSFAYFNCRNLTGLWIGDHNDNSVYLNVPTMIRSFYNCVKLNASVNIGPGVTTMTGAFSDCTDLRKVTGVEVMDGPLKADNAFCNCVNLQGYAWAPRNLTEATNMYYGSGVHQAVVPTTGKNLQYMYGDCLNLFRMKDNPFTLNIYSAMNADGMFVSCTNLTNSLHLISTNTSILHIADMFRGCFRLSGTIYIDCPSTIYQLSLLNAFQDTSIRVVVLNTGTITATNAGVFYSAFLNIFSKTYLPSTNKYIIVTDTNLFEAVNTQPTRLINMLQGGIFNGSNIFYSSNMNIPVSFYNSTSVVASNNIKARKVVGDVNQHIFFAYVPKSDINFNDLFNDLV